MNNSLVLFIFISLSVNSYGQFGAQQIISTSGDDPNEIFSADLDGDNDMDIIVSSIQDNKLVWYENIDGLGNFDVAKLINSNSTTAHDLKAVDVDGDDDIDIIVAHSIGETLVWYENLDGLGDFSEAQTIDNDIYGFRAVFAADIDGDSDIDLFSTSGPDQIVWYENIDGTGAFGPEQIIGVPGGYLNSLVGVDLDGDGDMDVLTASSVSQQGRISWFENIDGGGTFDNLQLISSETVVLKSIFAADMDGDNDVDVVSASRNDNKIAWYENTNGLGNFGSQQVISNTAYYAFSVFATDLDNDLDLDLLTARGDDFISYYENIDGVGTFSAENIISSEADGAVDIFSADLNGDGDMDAISISSFDDKVAWYGNQLLGIGDESSLSFKVSPNPAADTLYIDTNGNSYSFYAIYDSKGVLIITGNYPQEGISTSRLAQGLYVLELIKEGLIHREKFIKN